MFSDVSLSPAESECRPKLGAFVSYHCNWMGAISILIGLYIIILISCCAHYVYKKTKSKDCYEKNTELKDEEYNLIHKDK